MMLWLNRTDLSSTITLTVVTGDQCPCMISRDANNPTYSEQWHRDNSGEDDCQGTGLINSSTADTTLKCILGTWGIISNSIPGAKKVLTEIGEVNTTDLFGYGFVNTSTLAFTSLLSYTEYNAYITYSSVEYNIKDVFEVMNIGEVARFSRKA